MSGVHCQKFPACMEFGAANTVPMCSADDCPGAQGIKLAAMIFAKQEPQTEDEDILAEMRAQLWAAGLDLEESQFIARMLFRNGKRIVSSANP
jgi:hypothetical protein